MLNTKKIDSVRGLNQLRIVFLLVALSAVIFWIDWHLPLGVAAGVPYVSVVLLAMWLPGRRAIILVALGCSILVLLGYVISAAEGIPWMVLANRFLALFAIWSATYLSMGRIKVAQQQRKADKRLSAVMMTAADGIVSITSSGIIEAFNPAAERIFGYSLNEVLGQNIRMLMPSPFAEGHDGYMQHYMQTRIAKVIGIGREVEGLRKDRTVFPMDLAVSEMEVGDEVMFVGVIRDISERKHVESELKHSRLSLEMAQRIARMGSWEWDIPTGKITWTDGIYSIFGLSREKHEPTYEKFFNAVHPEDQDAVTSALDQAMKGESAYQVEHRVVWPDGTIRQVHGQGEVYRNGNGDPVSMIGTIQDITMQYEAQEKLLAAEENLRHAEVAKAELAGIHKVTATFAHEINNPLTGIVGMVQLLQEKTEVGSDEREMLEETMAAAKRIKEVILKMQSIEQVEFKDYIGKTKIIDLDKSS